MQLSMRSLRKLAGLVFIATLGLVSAAPAVAVCFAHDKAGAGGVDLDRSVGPRTFPVAEEFSGAFLVATVKVIALLQVNAHANDDAKPLAQLYRVVPLETFKGLALPEFTIYDEKNSGSFDMKTGRTYLAFVHSANGRSVIDNCGWSDELSAASETLSKVRDIAATKHPPSSP